MCGILAVIGEYSKEKVKRAISMQQHRGPDDSGIYFDNKLALAHKRLSIIDLKTGKQPMISDKGNIIIYNGEIYNFKEIKEEITKERRYSFKTNSDTEVILAAYDVWGKRCVKKFNGMFSFIIWDKEKRELFVARDRLGIKPLYYYKDGKKLIFSSEIKSILEFVSPKINKEILYDYFNYFIQIGNSTLFKGIKTFPKACFASISRTKTTVSKYWDFNYKEEEKQNKEEEKEELKNLLEESVKKRLIADVPVGAFLSGGLDSSLITAIMKKHNKNLKTFSVAYDVDNKENEYAEETAKILGTEHYSLKISAEEFKNALRDMIKKYDQPISFASSIPLYFVAKLTKNKVKVVLTGEGADELFAGYSRYWRLQKMIKLKKKFPRFIKNIIYKITENSPDPRYRKYFEILTRKFNFDYITGINIFIGKERDNLLKIRQENIQKKHVEKLFSEKNTNLLNRILWIDLNTYLQELLTKQDRMSMAASIESRVPFLDHNIVEFSSKLKEENKLANKVGKKILREVSKEYLPEEVIKRKKIGFTVPINKWFKTSLRGYIEEQLSSEILDEFFEREEINRLLELNRKGKNVSLQLWALLNFKIWCEIYIKRDKVSQDVS